jgi:hypothetical protein
MPICLLGSRNSRKTAAVSSPFSISRRASAPFALLCACFLVGGLSADDAPQGVPTRPAASDYAANAQWQTATFAASLLPAKQVEHLFAFDISKSFVVFEVALYADSNAALKVSRAAFVVNDIHSTEPDTVASAIERQNQPPMPSSHPLGIETSATIGVQHGTDPYSGRPASGVYTGGSVTAETGGRRDGGYPTQDAKPGGTAEDRRMLAAQLRVRGIPEGPVNHPVAGYIYFRKSDIKSRGGNYELQYLAEEEGTGATHAITLTVPGKTR